MLRFVQMILILIAVPLAGMGCSAGGEISNQDSSVQPPGWPSDDPGGNTDPNPGNNPSDSAPPPNPGSTSDGAAGSVTDAGAAGGSDGTGPGNVQPPGPLPLGGICTQDAECAAGELCYKPDPANAKGTCVKGSCTTNADCESAETKQNNYLSLCLERQTWDIDANGNKTNLKTFKHCAFLCKWSTTSYACPPSHSCKLVSNYHFCVPN